MTRYHTVTKMIKSHNNVVTVRDVLVGLEEIAKKKSIEFPIFKRNGQIDTYSFFGKKL